MIKIEFPRIFSSTKTKIHLMKIEKLKINKKFKNLYQQEPEKVDEICRSIKENGYDRTQPIIILNDGTVIDGHSRLMAAEQAGLKEIFVLVKEGIESETDALLYEEHLQLSHRNLSEAEKLIHLENLLKLKKQAQLEGKDITEFTDESLAKKLDVSPRQVQKMREVESKASPEQLESIRSGETTLNKVHEEIKKVQGLSRKSPGAKNTPEISSPSLNNAKQKVEMSNRYFYKVISLIEKNLPGTQIPEKLKTDLAELLKGVNHETK
ncbi:MAG: ParB N-terminal domain-containing protein [Treponema sp.]|nr:ParB N-terminal domain-containing protein [Treponema sp.]